MSPTWGPSLTSARQAERGQGAGLSPPYDQASTVTSPVPTAGPSRTGGPYLPISSARTWASSGAVAGSKWLVRRLIPTTPLPVVGVANQTVISSAPLRADI